MVFCNDEAVGVIALVDICVKGPHMTPFVATNIPHFHDWITKNGSGKLSGVTVGWWLTYILAKSFSN